MTGPSPDVAAARVAVRTALAPFGPGARVLVACSGGADSLALAATTAFLAPRIGLLAGSVTVDHRLRPGSTEEAHTVAARCRALGLDPALVATAVVGERGGPEAAAREARYAVLRRVADELGAGPVVLLLGHTMDDQAETVLLGLARGSGARSIAGMPEVTELPGRRGAPVALVRPFLALRRARTEQVCRDLGLEWLADPTNAADGPWRAADGSPLRRAALRDRALPALVDALGPGVVPALARTATQLRRDADYLDAAARDLLARAREAAVPEGGGVAVDAAVLGAAHAALRTRALLAAALEAGATPGDVKAVHVAELDRLLTDYHGQGPLPLPGGLEARRACGRLVVTRTRPAGGTQVDSSDVGRDLERVLVTEEQIGTRLTEMATEIDADYAGKGLLLVGVLRGAVMVMADLSRKLHLPVEMDWMAVSSYGSGTKSSGVVRILKDLDTDIHDRHVLIVEDIIDSGLTLSWLQANLRSREPASLEVATLLRKPDAAQVDVDVRYVGFDIPPEFVVGYGLDYAEKYRNLPFVATLAPHVYGG